MLFRKLTSAIVALTIVAAPAAAQSASAGRSAAPAPAQSKLGGSSTLLLVAAIAAFGIAVLFLTDKDEDQPVSA